MDTLWVVSAVLLTIILVPTLVAWWLKLDIFSKKDGDDDTRA